MNQIEQMKIDVKSLAFQPVNVPGLERLPVHFAGDFPVEFVIRRLEDVPLRVRPNEARLLQAAPQQP